MVVGSIELVPLRDAVGLLANYVDAYPDVPPEAWEQYRVLYPELFAGPSWRLPCASYLIRSAAGTLLVDTGAGPPGSWGWKTETEGELPAALAAHGLERDDVDVVFLTHLHIDHLGWNTDANGFPFFPRARCCGVRGARPLSRAHGPSHPLRRRGSGPARRRRRPPCASRAPRLALRVGPRPAGCGRDARVADSASRDRDVVVACGHYPEGGIGCVVADAGRVVWRPLDGC